MLTNVSTRDNIKMFTRPRFESQLITYTLQLQKIGHRRDEMMARWIAAIRQ